MTNSIPKIMTVPQASELLKQQGISIGETRLRLWCKDGTLPCVYAGRKVLLNYDTLIRFLSGESLDKNERLK